MVQCTVSTTFQPEIPTPWSCDQLWVQTIWIVTYDRRHRKCTCNWRPGLTTVLQRPRQAKPHIKLSTGPSTQQKRRVKSFTDSHDKSVKPPNRVSGGNAPSLFFPLSQHVAHSSTGTYCLTAVCLCAAATWNNWENHSLHIPSGENTPLFIPENKYFQECAKTAGEHAGVINILCLYDFSTTAVCCSIHLPVPPWSFHMTHISVI